jgi:hypothetical protein
MPDHMIYRNIFLEKTRSVVQQIVMLQTDLIVSIHTYEDIVNVLARSRFGFTLDALCIAIYGIVYQKLSTISLRALRLILYITFSQLNIGFFVYFTRLYHARILSKLNAVGGQLGTYAFVLAE